MQSQIILYCKELIDKNNQKDLQQYIDQLIYNTDYEDIHPNWQYIFQKIYLHACLKKRSIIVSWLENDIFKLFDSVSQIALRQSFKYGHYLLNKK